MATRKEQRDLDAKMELFANFRSRRTASQLGHREVGQDKFGELGFRELDRNRRNHFIFATAGMIEWPRLKIVKLVYRRRYLQTLQVVKLIAKLATS